MKNGEKRNFEIPRKRKTAKTGKSVFVRPLIVDAEKKTDRSNSLCTSQQWTVVRIYSSGIDYTDSKV